MHPICCQLGGLTIHWFGVMMALGFFASLAHWTALGRSQGRDFGYCSDLLFWVMVSGVAGARLAYVISDWPYFLAHPMKMVRVDEGGVIFYGGVAGSLAALFVFARRRDERFVALLDFVATALPLGHAFGRIGCFFNGCCHGRLQAGARAVTYPAESPAWWRHVEEGLITRLDGRSLPVYPVQLYEAAFNLLLYAGLIWAYRRRSADGQVTGLYLMVYPTARFLAEFLRGDERMQGWQGLNTAQLVSVVAFMAGGLLLARSCRANQVG